MFAIFAPLSIFPENTFFCSQQNRFRFLGGLHDDAAINYPRLIEKQSHTCIWTQAKTHPCVVRCYGHFFVVFFKLILTKIERVRERVRELLCKMA